MKPAFTPGTTFAGYRVESLVGRGGMGVVYRATDLSLERPVALKLIAPELAEDERFRGRFLREPRLAASLDHPNVIPIYEAGEHDGQLYLAMRLVEGSDLKSVLEREHKLAPERALAILSQVAGALDAAHRRALVHRDVKPANVLLDESGHAYLTDFGITKQLGGASTDTGRVVGTLDYLAPEQIRGDPVDGRTDGYALGCVLYECLAGEPPFRRETEPETMWAHMQDEPPALRGHAALDPVLRKALAKDREDRYGTCSELIEAAADALGLSAPRSARPPLLPWALRRRGRLVLAVGLFLLAGTIAATIAALTGGGGSGIEPVGNGVAALAAGDDGVVSFTEAATAPGNIAVGAGGIWVLSAEDRTVARIDPETRAVVRKFRTQGVPVDLAAGAGALWLATEQGEKRFVSRVDPRTGDVTRRSRLPEGSYPGDLPFQNWTWAYPTIAIGAGAVWVMNPDRTVSRLDPATGRPVTTIDVDAATIAAGEEGVWFISGDDPRSVVRIDPETNRAGRRIRVGTSNLSAIALAAGSIWVSAEADGVVWRIEPEPSPILRTIDLGVGVTYLAAGAGGVWAVNYARGTVSRIDPRTNDVEDQLPVGAVHGLAAGAGSAWVSMAGATAQDGLPRSCQALESVGGKPDVLIASDLPLQGPGGAGPRAMADAIEAVLRRHGFRAGERSVGYRSCDDSTAQQGFFDARTCAANASSYARAERLVAVIGTYNSFCAQIEIPILNRAPGGPLAMISPANTSPGLTRQGESALWGYRGEPEVYYPTGERNYVRVLPADDMHGAAHALLARQLGVRRAFVLYEDGAFWRDLLARPFRYAARQLGLEVMGSATFDPEANDYDAVANRVARSGAQAVVLGADPYFGGDRLLKALRARLGRRVEILGGFYFAAGVPDLLEQVGSAAHGVYVATSDLPRAELDLTPAAERFLQEFGQAHSEGFVLEAAQTAELVLQAIARSDGTRASVLQELKASRVRDGLLGSFRFDRNGDITPATVPIVRITGSTPPGAGLPSGLQGAVVDRVVEIPRRLIR
jgi:ABC-type branched-subunit amino acid transport system substrate-binding protein/DNA-binding beta-propeller fold protein YncE